MLIGYVNGKYVDLSKPNIAIEDRGYQFADGVYEVIRYYQGLPFLLDEHLERLYRSAALIGISIAQTKSQFKTIAEHLIEKNQVKDGDLYLQVTRGVYTRQHWVSEELKPVVVMTIRPSQKISNNDLEQGVKIITVLDDRWKRCHIKSISLLANILAKREASSCGAKEAVFVSEDNAVTEGASSNIFIAKEGVVYTYPEGNSILSGITRKEVIKYCQSMGIKLVEEKFTMESLEKADEVFITSTTFEILPVCQVNDDIIGAGRPGSIWKRLFGMYQETIKAKTTK